MISGKLPPGKLSQGKLPLGILLLDKPSEHTSFDVVARMRGIAHTKKIGHGGTLDPMATGVLPLFFGRATKACDVLPDQSKSYAATFQLGLSTDTQDITGTVMRRRPVVVDKVAVCAMLERFVGTQAQLPPMYSAVQVGGQRLYDLARQGIEVDRDAREIEIHSIQLLSWDEAAGVYTVEVACSKGAYIRTLCHDIGEALGCGATLTALRRTRACGYSIEQCVTLEQCEALAAADALWDHLLPVETAFAQLPRITLTETLAGHFCNGVPLFLGQLGALPVGMCSIYREDGLFLGLATPDLERGQLRQNKLFHLV